MADVSIHATRVGGDLNAFAASARRVSFYPRHPCGWRRVEAQKKRRTIKVSIHATRVGGDRLLCSRSACSVHVSIRATRVGGDPKIGSGAVKSMVSIRATRVGGDEQPPPSSGARRSFYPRHPCGWRQFVCQRLRMGTHVSIRATRVGGDRQHAYTPPQSHCFYPRHPCGWRRQGDH